MGYFPFVFCFSNFIFSADLFINYLMVTDDKETHVRRLYHQDSLYHAKEEQSTDGHPDIDFFT
ncbi:MAG: hypothetical protein A3J85_03925 [Desulfobacula sp. RIFOXYA12_FULL_46_16]|nr:MAG: hypothetical protein A3J85_03925 [Desulfobacula sp. RIFOXYA12_FULL_46_16]OGR61243.1 MAG: hypothetical protein A3J80_00825 [Desulfobacula sp. RIFOXYB2_FULL_45_6]